MTERPNEAQSADETAADSQDGDNENGGTINDPLTRSDVEAPRVPFQAESSANE